jgi:hypothetical protein
MTLLRVKDWLSLLGFEKIEQRTFFFAPPFRSHYLRSSWLEYFGNQARQVCRPLAGGKQQTAIPVTDSARTFV